MRRALVIMLLVTTATPALAASRDREDAEIARTADKLNDPATQSAMSGMMVAMADMVMDLRVDKLRAAIARIDPESRDDGREWDRARTVGDMIERDDPNFRENLANSTQRTVGTMGALAGSMADMVPDLRDMAERVGRQVEKAMNRFPRD